MDATLDALNIFDINAMGIEHEPRKRVGGYVHKEQLEFYTFEGEGDNEEYQR